MRQNSENLETLPAELQGRLQLDFTQACAAMGLPESTMELEIARGQGPLFFKIGRRRFTTVELLKEWQAGRISDARAKRSEVTV